MTASGGETGSTVRARFAKLFGIFFRYGVLKTTPLSVPVHRFKVTQEAARPTF